MRLLPLLVALLLLPLSGLTAGFSAEAPSTTDRWLVITDSSEEGLQVERVTRTLDPLAARPAHDGGESGWTCSAFAPLEVACADRSLGHADHLSHHLILPFCTDADLGGCYSGVLTSTLIGQYNRDDPRMLRCEILWLGAATNTLASLEAPAGADLGPVVEASYEITCETSGLFPSNQRWGQFCTSEHLTPLTGPGGIGAWGCENQWH